MARTVTLLDNYTGSTAGDAIAVDGTYMIFIDGTTVGTITFEAAESEDGSYEAIEEASFTDKTRRLITLPSCFLRANPTSSTAITVKLLPLTR